MSTMPCRVVLEVVGASEEVVVSFPVAVVVVVVVVVVDVVVVVVVESPSLGRKPPNLTTNGGCLSSLKYSFQGWHRTDRGEIRSFSW